MFSFSKFQSYQLNAFSVVSIINFMMTLRFDIFVAKYSWIEEGLTSNCSFPSLVFFVTAAISLTMIFVIFHRHFLTTAEEVTIEKDISLLIEYVHLTFVDD